MARATEEERQTIVAWVRQHEGERVNWKRFAEAVDMSQGHLATVVKSCLKEGSVIEPGGYGSKVYHIGTGTPPPASTPVVKPESELESVTESDPVELETVPEAVVTEEFSDTNLPFGNTPAPSTPAPVTQSKPSTVAPSDEEPSAPVAQSKPSTPAIPRAKPLGISDPSNIKVLLLDPLAKGPGLGRGLDPWKTGLEIGFETLGYDYTEMNDSSVFKPASKNEGLVKQLSSVFEQFDLVVVSDLTNRSIEWPVLAEALAVSQTRWFTYTHVPEYKKASFIHDLFVRTSNFGFIACASERDGALYKKRHNLDIDVLTMPHLPFVLTDDVFTDGEWVVNSSVISGMKGQIETCKLAKVGMKVALWGECIESPFGPESFTLLGKLLEDGFELVEGNAEKHNRENWTVKSGEGRVSYKGGYEDPTVPMREARIHTNFTSIGRVFGHLEYSTLEALSFGIPCIVPNNHLPEETPGVAGVNYDSPKRPANRDPEEIVTVAQGITKMDDKERKAVRAWIEDKHSPVKYVERLLARISS